MTVDVELLRRASALTGHPTQAQAVDAALEHLIALQRQVEALNAITGMGWDGDIDSLRGGRSFDDKPDRS